MSFSSVFQSVRLPERNHEVRKFIPRWLSFGKSYLENPCKPWLLGGNQPWIGLFQVWEMHWMNMCLDSGPRQLYLEMCQKTGFFANDKPQPTLQKLCILCLLFEMDYIPNIYVLLANIGRYFSVLHHATVIKKSKASNWGAHMTVAILTTIYLLITIVFMGCTK